jgi:hypothetical protein
MLTVLLYAPFWAGPQGLAAIWNQTGSLGWSLATVLIAVIERATGARADLLVRIALFAVWVGVCVLILRRIPVERSRGLAASSAWLLVTSLLLLTSAVYGHYFVPAIALAAVAGNAVLDRLVMWLSLGGLVVYAVGALGWVFVPTWIGSMEYQVVGSLVLFGPAAVVSVLTWRQASSQGRGLVQPTRE